MASVAAGCDQCNGQPAGTFVPADRHQSSTSQVHLRLTPRCGVRTYLPTETGQPHEVVLKTARQPSGHLGGDRDTCETGHGLMLMCPNRARPAVAQLGGSVLVVGLWMLGQGSS